MILDASAVVAILNDEGERLEFNQLVDASPNVRLSAASLLEAAIVLRAERHAALDAYLAEGEVDVVPFDAEQARVARQAYARFGKGSGSPARLNFGDCFSYALAKVTEEPLLFKGEDFTHTDVTPAR